MDKLLEDKFFYDELCIDKFCNEKLRNDELRNDKLRNDELHDNEYRYGIVMKNFVMTTGNYVKFVIANYELIPKVPLKVRFYAHIFFGCTFTEVKLTFLKSA